MTQENFFVLKNYYYFNLRWVSHHVGNIQNGGPSGPALLPVGIQTQVSGEEICFVRTALIPVGIQTQVSG